MKQSDRLKLQVLSGHASEADMHAAGYDAITAIKTAPDAMLLRDFSDSDFEVKKVGDRRFSFAFSNEKVDQGGDILKASGWDLKVFRSNPVLIWAHNGSDRPPLGTVPKIAKDADVAGAKGLAGEVEFATKGIDPFIDTVAALVEDRVIKATSVGCMLLKLKVVNDEEERTKLGLGPFGVFSEKHRLFEISLCSIPMNSDALARSCEELLSKERATKQGVETFLKSQTMTEMDYARAIDDICKKFQVQIPFAMKGEPVTATDNLEGTYTFTGPNFDTPVTAKDMLGAFDRLTEAFDKQLDANEKIVDQNTKLLSLVARSGDTNVIEDTKDGGGEDSTDMKAARDFKDAVG